MLLIFIFYIFIFELGLYSQVIQIFNSTYSKYFYNPYIMTNYSKMKIPDKWYLKDTEDDSYYLVGPSLSLFNEQQFMTVTRNNKAIEKYNFYMDKNFCVDSNISSITNNVNFIDMNSTTQIEFQSTVIFCKKTIRDDSPYIAYFNKALMTQIVIMPYQEEYINSYLKLLKSIHYTTNKDDMPLWLKNKLLY